MLFLRSHCDHCLSMINSIFLIKVNIEREFNCLNPAQHEMILKRGTLGKIADFA